MAMCSYFRREKGVSLHDHAFYAWLKTLANGDDVWSAILEWVDSKGALRDYEKPALLRKWRRRFDDTGAMRFSFACFNGWRLLGYDHPEFRVLMRGMERFLKPEDAAHGYALFRYVDGIDFKFEIDYRRKRIVQTYKNRGLSYRVGYHQEKIAIPPAILALTHAPPVRILERRFECRSRSSRKFWTISAKGNTVAIRFGRLGTDGRKQTKRLDDTAKLRRFVEARIAQKLGKGYREVSKLRD